MTGASANERMKVLTTFTVLADMAANVAGDAADVVSITKPGAEIHGYETHTPRYCEGFKCRFNIVERNESRTLV